VARPSRQTDQRLIQAAQDLMRRSALSQLNLRQLADKAGVNLGMIHYHFKTKDQFIKAVLKDTYARFFKDFSLQVEGEKEPLAKLRRALISLGQFSYENRHLILSLLQDALNRDPSAKDFAKQLIAQHSQVILALLQQCQKEGSLVQAPLPMLMSYVMPAATTHGTILGLMEHVDADPSLIENMKATVLRPEAIEQRVDWILAGLAPGQVPGPLKPKKKSQTKKRA
jgi:AcrR family transcriptional regulator